MVERYSNTPVNTKQQTHKSGRNSSSDLSRESIKIDNLPDDKSQISDRGLRHDLEKQVFISDGAINREFQKVSAIRAFHLYKLLSDVSASG